MGVWMGVGEMVTKKRFSSPVCPVQTQANGVMVGTPTSFSLSLFRLYAQSTLAEYGSGVHAETGARGVYVLANISNEARVILKAGVPLPW